MPFPPSILSSLSVRAMKLQPAAVAQSVRFDGRIARFFKPNSAALSVSKGFA